MSQAVDLRGTDIQEIDLANSLANSGHVDAFLTSPDCTRLFDGPYNGVVTQALCQIYIGPLVGGSVSPRQSIPKGTYRVFVQAWSTNEASNLFSVDVGVYTDRCRPNLVAP